LGCPEIHDWPRRLCRDNADCHIWFRGKAANCAKSWRKGPNAAAGWRVAASERFELPTLAFEARCSIQLSYEATEQSL
jgi:hypothetical protein